LKAGITERCTAYLGQFDHLESLNIGDYISSRQRIDEALANLKRLPRLQSLTIFSLRVTNEGLAYLGESKQLKSLKLHHAIAPMPVTDDGLEHLKGLTGLQALTLGISKMTDKGLGAVANLKNLEFIDLKPTTRAEITDEGLLQLRTLPALKELRIHQSIQHDGSKVTEEGIAALSKELPGLKIVR
jgi:hypothetical protein